MPDNKDLLNFKYGSQSEYDSLKKKDENVLYFTDEGRIFKGDKEYTRPALSGTEVPQVACTPRSFYMRNVDQVGDEGGESFSPACRELWYNETGDPSGWVQVVYGRLAYSEGGFTPCETIFDSVLNSTDVPTTLQGWKVFYDVFNKGSSLIEGEWYRVTLDSKEYDVQCKVVSGEDLGAMSGVRFIGNIKFLNQVYHEIGEKVPFTNEATEEPFIIHSNNVICIGYESDSYNLSVQRLEGSPEIVHKLDPKYYERLAWEEGTDEVVYDQKLTFSEGVVEATTSDTVLISGGRYNVKIDGDSWDVTAYSMDEGGAHIVVLGNESIVMGDAGTRDLNKPFVIGYGCIDGEHFFSIYAFENFSLPDGIIPLEGEHHVIITHRNTTVKKIDEKFLPDSVPAFPDYEQNNYLAKDYIKNRPFYSVILRTTAAEAIARGAPVYDIMPNNPGVAFMVKICDYVPFNDDMRSARFWGVSVDEGYGIEVLDYGWRIVGNDDTPLIAIKDIDLFNKNFNEYEPFEEPGVYMFYVTGYESALAIELPVKKEYSGENIKISWENIKDAPFGKISGRRIVGCEYNTGKECYYTKENSSTWTEEVTFHRFCAYYFTADEMIGCTLLLSDGSTLVVTDDSFLHKNSEIGFWEINNLIISSKEANPYEESGTYLYYNGGGAPTDGTFTSDATGVYVKEIIFPDEIKQVPLDLIPNEIPRVNSAKTGEAIVVKSVNDDGTAAVCETVELPGWKKSNTVTFDGVIEDKYCIPFTQPNNANHQLVQVSKRPFEITEETLTELNLKMFDRIYGKDELSFTIEQDGPLTLIGTKETRVVIIAHQDFSEGDKAIPKGVYFMYGSDKFYTVSVAYKEVSQINPEFLPKGGFGHTTSSINTVTWDGDTTGKVVIPDFATSRDDSSFVRVYDKFSAISKESVKYLAVEQEGELYEITKNYCTVVESDGITFIADSNVTQAYVMTVPAGYEEMGLVEGIYFFNGYVEAGTVGEDKKALRTVKTELELETVHKIDSQFIPTEGFASEDYVDESMAQAKEYTDSQRLGYTEHRTLTFDGTLDDMTSISDGIYTVKLSDEVIDLKSVKKIALKFNPDSPPEELDVTSDNSRMEDIGGGEVVLFGQYSGSEFPALMTLENSNTAPSGVGTYVIGYDTETVHGWVSQVELHTIHQIPAEYIPATVITDEEIDALIASII